MVDVSDFSKAKPGFKPPPIPKEATGLPGAVTKLKQAKDLVDSIGSIVKSVETLVGPMIKKKMEMGGQNLGGNVEMPPKKEDVAPAPPKTEKTKESPKESKADVEAYFKTDEGMNTIIEAIDRFIPLIGDAKLSEVKQALVELKGDSKNEPSKTKKTGK